MKIYHETKIIKSKNYIVLKDLEVYQRARQLSVMGWKIYDKLDWQNKKTMGDQFIRATDSVGANIAEGYGRFHYLDKIRFYYNSRGSLLECATHWSELLFERNRISKDQHISYKKVADQLHVKLNNLIRSTYQSKQGK
ncbi:MAG: four helix bundle protein [Bacteroidota bacterium]